MFLYYKQLREQGWEPEVVICLQTDKQFLAFHFVIDHNNNKISKDSCL